MPEETSSEMGTEAKVYRVHSELYPFAFIADLTERGLMDPKVWDVMATAMARSFGLLGPNEKMRPIAGDWDDLEVPGLDDIHLMNGLANRSLGGGMAAVNQYYEDLLRKLVDLRVKKLYGISA